MKQLGSSTPQTHDFTEAWNAAIAGEGVTVGVLDGGTDFGHPDLIGTWQTWSGLTTDRPTTAGTAGRRRSTRTATSSCCAAPSQIDRGLSWYVETDRPASDRQGPQRRAP